MERKGKDGYLESMKCLLDVAYGQTGAVAAAVLFKDWADGQPAKEVTAVIKQVAPYQSGQFYKRELPCLQAVISKINDPINCFIVDSYVWLDGGRKGLGGYLYDVVQPVPVIGVAKTTFKEAQSSMPILRGTSQTPLMISAVGLDLNLAAQYIQNMHGPYRLPTLIKRVDRLCRDHIKGSP